MKTQKHISPSFPVIFISLVMALPHPALAAELLVPTEYPTIQAAVDAANSGDTIRIAAGNYDQQVVISNKANLTIAGEPGTVIRATTAMSQIPGGTTYPLLAIIQSQVVLTGLILDGVQLGDSYPNALRGIVFRGSSGQVTNCTVRGFRGAASTEARGISVVNAVSLGTPTVQLSAINSTFADNFWSIVLGGDDANPTLLRTRFTIERNTFTGWGPASTVAHLGVFIATGAGGELRGNLMTGFSYRGTTLGFSGPILAHDGLFPSRGFAPLQPIRYEGNRFLTNDHHIVMVAANGSQVVSNIFQGVGPGWLRWGGLALSGTNVLVANNEFSDLPIGIELFGGENNGNTLRGVATNPSILSNRFCRVSEPIRAQPLANGVVEQGTELPCPSPTPRDLHVPSEYLSVQAAVDAAVSGDTIHIAAGDYYEQVVVANKRDLRLVGEPGAVFHATTGMTQTLIPYGWGLFPVLGVFRSDLTVRNITFDGHQTGSLYNSFLAVYYLGSGGRVENCSIRGFRGPGATGYGAVGLRMQNTVSIGTPPVEIGVFNNDFEDNEVALHIRGEPVLNPGLLRTRFTIEGNTITGVGPSAAAFQGITIRNGATGVVKSNLIWNFSYTGTGEAFGSGIAAFDDNARTRTNPAFVPLLPVRYEGNTFSNNDEHLVIIGGNGSEVVNNIFQGAGPDAPRWGALALSGTNIIVANNDFSDLPTGIVLFGAENFLSGWPLISPAADPKLIANWFCDVPEMIRTNPLVTGVQAQGTETCPFTPRFQSISRPGPGDVRALLRGWHGESVIIESSSNLVNWVTVQTNVMGLPTFEYRDTNQDGVAQRFYRAHRP